MLFRHIDALEVAIDEFERVSRAELAADWLCVLPLIEISMSLKHVGHCDFLLLELITLVSLV